MIKKAKNSCANFKQQEKQHLLSYMNGMEHVVKKPPQCKNCIYYTSSQCNSDLPVDYKETNFIC